MIQIDKPRIAIILCSICTHLYKLALEIKKGAEESGLADVNLYQFPEVLPKEILDDMEAPEKPNLPIITHDIFNRADGIIFGIPTLFETIPAQIKDFIDTYGQFRVREGLDGKLAGIFMSNGDHHSGQEKNFLNFLSTLIHFGMIYVPFGFGSFHLQEDQKTIGGSSWNSSSVGGDIKNEPSEKELELGHIQGENFANYLAKCNGYFYQQSFLVEKDIRIGEKKIDSSTSIDIVKTQSSTSPKKISLINFFEKLTFNLGPVHPLYPV